MSMGGKRTLRLSHDGSFSALGFRRTDRSAVRVDLIRRLRSASSSVAPRASLILSSDISSLLNRSEVIAYQLGPGAGGGGAITVNGPSQSLLTQRPQASAHFFREELRLFPSREMPAFENFVEMDEIGVSTLRPTPRTLVDLFGENADGSWN